MRDLIAAAQHAREARWGQYGAAWPEGHRACTKCDQVLPLTEFHKHAACKGGYNSVCKTCRKPKSTAAYRDWSTEYRLFHGCKSRALRKGLEFTLTVEDIKIPDKCPVFNTPFEKGTDYAASVDRIDSSKGYTPDNIQIISRRANLLKNDGKLEEFEKLVTFLRNCEI